MLQDEPAVPKGNVVTGNISWGSGRWCDVYDFHAFDFHHTTTMRNNLVADAGFMRRRAQPEKTLDPYCLNIDGKEGYALLPTASKDSWLKLARTVQSRRQTLLRTFRQFSRQRCAVSNSENRLPSCSIRKYSTPPTDSAAARISVHGATPSPNKTR